MVELITYFVNATALSALYALVAIGFTLIFGVGGILNFAHGAFILIGAYTSYLITDEGILALHPVLGVAAGIAVTAAVAGVMYKGLIKRIQDRAVLVLLITIVVGFLIRHTVRIFYGVGAFTVPRLISGEFSLLGITFQQYRVFVFLVSWACIFTLLILVNNTTVGKSIIATSISKKGSALVGIDTDRVLLQTWILAGALAGLAGVLLAGFQSGSWNMGIQPMVLSFSIVVVGGLGSIRGSIIGAYIIGFLETAVTSFISPRLAGVVSLLLLIIVLQIKPSGLYGREGSV